MPPYAMEDLASTSLRRIRQSSYLVLLLFVLCAAAAAGNDTILAFEMLNQARANQGLQPMGWSLTLAAYADFWANEMASGREPFSHASGAYRPGQGENLYEEQSTECNPATSTPLETAMGVWLAQSVLYDGQPITTGQEPWLHWCE